MNGIPLRRLAHRGTVQASAWWLQRGWIDEAELRRRVLRLWEPGATLHALDDGLCLRLLLPRAVDCAAALAVPLCADQGVLSSAPLEAGEREALAAPAGAVVLMRAGSAAVVPVGEAVDPADWLALDEFTVRTVAPLADPLAPTPVIVEPAAVVDRDTLAGTIGAAPDELDEVARRLRAAAAGTPLADDDAAAGAAAPAPWWGSWLGWLGGLGALWGNRRTAGSGGGSAAGGGFGSAPVDEAGAAALTRSEPPGWLRAFGDVLARWIYWSRLGRLLGRRQAAYLAEMMELVRRGDLEGLRRAIPLGSDATGAPARLALGVPGRRSELAISLGPRGAASALLVGGLFEDLRTLYRAAFERLQRAGRIDEAAFVLAELLRAHEEAVQFLEKHGRLRLAAQLAEARDLPPALVVRQWFLARDVRRAVRIAEEHGVFADAVARLERSHAHDAQLLRMLWAERLAARGDYPGAVQVALPIVEARALVKTWIDRALDVGGVAAARLLVQRLQLAPDEPEVVYARAAALLHDTGAGRLAERRAFVHELAAAPRSPVLEPLARLGLRAHLRDAARFGGVEQATRKLREVLLGHSGDGALRADLPPLFLGRPAPASLVEVAAADRGTLAIHDVAVLPSGQLLVALGELGARLLRPDGRVLAHFDLPAQALVVSDHGDRALLLATRGRSVRVARVDLAARRAEPWSELLLRGFAQDFDGFTWFVSEENGVVALDVEGDAPRARWRVDRLEGPVFCLTRDAEVLSFAVSEELAVQVWTYELPKLVLRARRSAPDGLLYGLIPGDSMSAWAEGRGGDGSSAQLVLKTANVNQVLATPRPGQPHSIALSRAWVVTVMEEEGAATVYAYRMSSGDPSRTLRLAGARRVRVRLNGDRLVVGDDLGRLIALDLPSGHALTDVRLHLAPPRR
jgi:hypothetical protein